MTRSKQAFSGGFLSTKKPPKAGEFGLPAKPSKGPLFHPHLTGFLKDYSSPENMAESLPVTMSAKWIFAEIRHLFFEKIQKIFPVFSFRFLTVFTGRRRRTFYAPIPSGKCMAAAPKAMLMMKCRTNLTHIAPIQTGNLDYQRDPFSEFPVGGLQIFPRKWTVLIF